MERIVISSVEVATTSVGEIVGAFEFASLTLLVSFVGVSVGESVGDFEYAVIGPAISDRISLLLPTS